MEKLIKILIKYKYVRKYFFNRLLDFIFLKFKKYKYDYEVKLNFDPNIQKILKNISDNFKDNLRLKDSIRKIIEASPFLIEKKQNELISVINDNLKYEIKGNFSDLETKAIEVKEKGYTLLETLKINSRDRESIISQSKKISCYNKHCNYLSHEEKKPWEVHKKKSHYASYDLADIVKIDELCKIIFDPRLCDLAFKTLGCTPTFYGLNLRWSFNASILT